VNLRASVLQISHKPRVRAMRGCGMELHCRRIPTGQRPLAARRDDELVVQTQGRNRCPPGSCQPNNLTAAIAPTEMFTPILRAGIEKGCFPIGYGIHRVGLCSFETATPGAGQSQICRVRSASACQREDVLDRQGSATDLLGSETIATTGAGRLNDFAAQGARDISHNRPSAGDQQRSSASQT